MSNWRTETETDLRDAESRLSSLVGSLSGEPTGDQLDSIWHAYVDVEKSVAFVRIEVDKENQGNFVNKEVYKVPDDRQALVFALGCLKRGAQSLASGNLENSLKQLRECRNYLRMLIIKKRRLAAGRAKRVHRS